jgi:hypothetical protein
MRRGGGEGRGLSTDQNLRDATDGAGKEVLGRLVDGVL